MNLEQMLAGLRDVEGVTGSFVVAPEGRCIATDSPRLLDGAFMGELAPRIVRLSESGAVLGHGLTTLVLRFQGGKLYLASFAGGVLGVLLSLQTNMATLKVAVGLTLRKLERVAREQREDEQLRESVRASEPPPSTQRSGVLQGTAFSDRTAVFGQKQSRRPVFFRGRRVDED